MKIDDLVWDDFVDYGVVPDEILLEIVRDIIANRLLCERQRSVYDSFSTLVEIVISEIKSIEK